MVTATMPRQKRIEVAPAEPATTPKSVSVAQHEEVINNLREKCLEVSFTIHRLPTSRRVKGTAATKVEQVLKAKKGGARTSWPMFTKEHPTVEALNKAISALESYRNTWTLQKGTDFTVDEEGNRKVEKGKRLLWADTHEEFYDGLVVHADRVARAAEGVNEALPQIKLKDKEIAGEGWEEAAYPAKIEAGIAKDENGLYIINFSDYQVSTKLSPQLYQQAVDRLNRRLDNDVETAVGRLVDGFCKDLTVFLNELVDRMKIYPIDGHPFRQYCRHEAAEVITTKTHDQDKSIPVGQVKLYLAYKDVPEDVQVPEGEKDKDYVVTVRRWVGPIPLEEYERQVKPQPSGERKKIYPSVIEGLLGEMASIRDKKSQIIGAYGQNIEGAFEGLFQAMTRMRGLHEHDEALGKKVASRVRTDDTYRGEVAQAITATIDALEDQVKEVKSVRRKFNRQLAKAVTFDE
jgi:hypothetical protein